MHSAISVVLVCLPLHFSHQAREHVEAGSGTPEWAGLRRRKSSLPLKKKKGVLGCKTLSLKTSVGLKTRKPLKGVLGCKTLSLKRSVGLQNRKPQKGVLGCKTLSLKRSVGLQNLSPKRSFGLQNPKP